MNQKKKKFALAGLGIAIFSSLAQAIYAVSGAPVIPEVCYTIFGSTLVGVGVLFYGLR